MIEELIADEADEQDQAAYMLELALLTEDLGGTFLYKTAGAMTPASKSRTAGQRLLDEYAATDAAEIYALLTGQPLTRPVIPREFALNSIFPNPFNPSVTIPYAIPRQVDVSIRIYDILGREIWNYTKDNQPAGKYSVLWNGLKQSGKPAASGLYLIQFTTPQFHAVQKAILLR